MWRDLRKKVVRELWLTLTDSGEGGSYRPDKHYMRGPGPKWHAKYGTLYAQIPQDAAPAPAPSLRNAAGHRA